MHVISTLQKPQIVSAIGAACIITIIIIIVVVVVVF